MLHITTARNICATYNYSEEYEYKKFSIMTALKNNIMFATVFFVTEENNSLCKHQLDLGEHFS